MRRSGYLGRHDLGVNAPFLDSVRRAFAEIDRSQWLNPEQIRSNQIKKLAKVVGHASRHVPFYRERYGGQMRIESIEDFRTLPIIDRHEIADCEIEHRTAKKLPFGDSALFSETTSGTTGDVVTILRTSNLEIWRHAAMIRELDLWNIDPTGSCAVMRVPANPSDPDWNADLQASVVDSWMRGAFGQLFGRATGFHIDASDHTREIAARVRRVAPDYLQATGTLLLSLIENLEGYRPRALLTIGENLYPHMRLELEASYCAPVYDVYAAVEANRVAATCPDGDGYHVHDENVFFELLNDDGSACEPGEIGNIVLTSLHNFASPIIRYDIGDLAEAPLRPCVCGRGLTTVASFQGREIARLVLEGGRKRIALGFVMTMNEIAGVKKFRLTQRGLDVFQLRITGRESLRDEEISRIKGSLERSVERTVSLTVTAVDDIPLGARGKLTKVEYVE